MGGHPDWCHCKVSVICDHAMPFCVLLPLVESLVGWVCNAVSLSGPQLEKKAGVCTVMPIDRCTEKNTCGPSEPSQPPYLHLPRMWDIRDLWLWRHMIQGNCAKICGLQTCMLPRELIQEGVAPPHIGVTQYSKRASARKLVKCCRW